jgi:hypothetical protein
MSALSTHSAAQNSKFLVQIKSKHVEKRNNSHTVDQLSLLRSLLSEDPKLANAVDIVHTSNSNPS